jgi:hypothetical protein
MMWPEERCKKDSRSGAPFFTLCCGTLDKHVRLDPLPEVPAALHALVTGDTDDGRHFRKHTREYNSVFQMASCAANVDRRFTDGTHNFRITGTMHHLMGPILPATAAAAAGGLTVDPNTTQFAQIYILDPVAAALRRQGIFEAQLLRPAILSRLEDMMREFNPHAREFVTAGEFLRQHPLAEYNIRINADPEDVPDRRRYNAPRAAEVAAIIPDARDDVHESERSNHRQIIVRKRDNGLQYLNEAHPAYDPLHYVLLFPRGEPGYHNDLPLYHPVGLERHVRDVTYEPYQVR